MTISTSFINLAIIIAYLSSSLTTRVLGFNNTRNDNLVMYWGQNSYGAANPSDTANYQQNLAYYCTPDSAVDVLVLSFMDVFFGTGNLPEINFANSCGGPAFSGTDLLECSQIGTDIQTCQNAGKAVLLSAGGASGAYSFSSDSQAQGFADLVWNTFLGGTSSTRPFGNAVLDGVDLDIEGGGSTGYAAFVTQLRTHMNGASKQYYVTAAPQCPYPDAEIGPALDAADFDAVFVQFYNNYCNAGTSNFNFATWDDWARNTSPNKDVKVFLGVPASSSAASTGYNAPSALTTIIQQTQEQFPSFGGVMMWDASQAYANGRFDTITKNALTNGSPPPIPPSGPSSSSSSSSSSTTTKTTSTSTFKTTSTTSTSTSTSTTPSSSPTPTSCDGISAWNSQTAYVGGNEVVYNGNIWEAKWWSEADTPGGVAGDWQNMGSCTAAAVTESFQSAMKAVSNADPQGALSADTPSPFGDGSSWQVSQGTKNVTIPSNSTTAATSSSKSTKNNRPTPMRRNSRLFRYVSN